MQKEQAKISNETFPDWFVEKVTEKRKNGNGQKDIMVGGEPFFDFSNPDVGILLLHGFSSTPAQFIEFGEYLSSEGISYYAPLIAGHGTKPHDLAKSTIDDWHQSIEQAFNKLAEHVDKVFVLGTSVGGNFAFYLAQKFPDRISGIISVSTPRKIKWQWLFKLRLYTYGWFKGHYTKPSRFYTIDYIDLHDEVTYPIIPCSALRRMFYYFRVLTPKHLAATTVPTLIIQAKGDPVISKKSAGYIHRTIKSKHKQIYMMDGKVHLPTNGRRKEIQNRVVQFIHEGV